MAAPPAAGAGSEAGPSAADRSSPDSDGLLPDASLGVAAAAVDVRRLRRGRRNGRHLARLAEVLGEAHGSPAAAPEHAAAAPGSSDRSHSQVRALLNDVLSLSTKWRSNSRRRSRQLASACVCNTFNSPLQLSVPSLVPVANSGIACWCCVGDMP